MTRLDTSVLLFRPGQARGGAAVRRTSHNDTPRAWTETLISWRRSPLPFFADFWGRAAGPRGRYSQPTNSNRLGVKSSRESLLAKKFCEGDCQHFFRSANWGKIDAGLSSLRIGFIILSACHARPILFAPATALLLLLHPDPPFRAHPPVAPCRSGPARRRRRKKLLIFCP
jgi:hypothetical protein